MMIPDGAGRTPSAAGMPRASRSSPNHPEPYTERLLQFRAGKVGTSTCREVASPEQETEKRRRVQCWPNIILRITM